MLRRSKAPVGERGSLVWSVQVPSQTGAALWATARWILNERFPGIGVLIINAGASATAPQKTGLGDR